MKHDRAFATGPAPPLPLPAPAPWPEAPARGLRRALRAAIGAGPAALVIVEDGALLSETFAHLTASGFAAIVAFAPPGLALPPVARQVARPGADPVATPTPDPARASFAGPSTGTVSGATAGAVPDPAPPPVALPAGLRLLRVPAATRRPHAAAEAATAALAAARPGAWLHLCYNAEFLFHPFCGTRSVGAMLAFHAEERRAAMPLTVVDLYPADLARHPDGTTPPGPGGGAHLDVAGYHAVPRPGPDGIALERQVVAHGGLRWRLARHLAGAPADILRTGLFRARPDLRMGADHRLSDPELNTMSCPWHRNLTAALCSFRAAKALRASPVACAAIDGFAGPWSAPFDWTDRQLMDLGLMEPGQWF